MKLSAVFAALALACVSAPACAQQTPANVSDADYQAFLAQADVASNPDTRPGYGYDPAVAACGPTPHRADIYACGGYGLAVISFDD